MEQYLRRNFPRDILMPVRPGEKSPMFPHKNDAWSWHLYDGVHNRRRLDVCVLLKDLCVVDVDTRELEEELEAMFPALREAPKERTKRGAHYWFARSPEADRDGHFDARSPRIAGVDFKTRCRNGTAGVVVIAPSAGRTWVREPGSEHEIGLIPNDVLEAVSKPSHAYVKRRFVFTDGGAVAEMEVCCLDTMAYFEPFLDGGAFDPEEPIAVPVEKATFEILIVALERKQCVAPITREVFARVLRAADLLGLNKEDYRRLVTGRLLWAYDVHDAGCQALIDPPSVEVVEVSAEVDICYEPLQRDDRWLFPRVRPVCEAGDIVVVGHRALNYMPDFVWSLVKEFPLMLAGGSVLANLTGTEDYHDFDLFPITTSEQEATEMVEKIRARLPGDVRVRHSGCALTIVTPEDMVVQIVLRLYDGPAQVLGSFDIAPCKVGMLYDQEAACIKTVALPSWFAAVRHRAFVLDPACWSGASVTRTLKYIARGYDCFVPGLRRAALVEDLQRSRSTTRRGWKLRLHAQKISNRCRDFSALMWAEKNLASKEGERIEEYDISRLLRRPTDESEYNLFIKATFRLVWAVRALARWAGFTKEQARKLQWARHGASGGRAFFTTSPRTFAAYHHPMYEKLVAMEHTFSEKV